MKKRKIPTRKCILTNEMFPKKDLLRIVKNKEGEISVDPTGKQAGRGAYVVSDLEVIKAAKETVREIFLCITRSYGTYL